MRTSNFVLLEILVSIQKVLFSNWRPLTTTAPLHFVISGCILPRRIKNESKNIKWCIFVSRFQIYFSFFGETTREKVLLFKTTFLLGKFTHNGPAFSSVWWWEVLMLHICSSNGDIHLQLPVPCGNVCCGHN